MKNLNLVTVKTSSIRNSQDLVAVQATYNLVDAMCENLERLNQLNHSVCKNCPFWNGSDCQLGDCDLLNPCCPHEEL